jgi:hypothetical protein
MVFNPLVNRWLSFGANKTDEQNYWRIIVQLPFDLYQLTNP